jgi:hypothetical protein
VSGGGKGKVCFLVSRDEEDANSWESMTPDGLFVKLNLRNYSHIRTSADPNLLAGYDSLPDPDDLEKAAIMERFLEWKTGGLDPIGALQAEESPLDRQSPRGREPRGYLERGGSGLDPRLRAVLPGNRGGRGGQRVGGTGRRFNRVWRRAREAGPTQVAGGAVAACGTFYKFYTLVVLNIGKIEAFFVLHAADGGRIARFCEFAANTFEWARKFSDKFDSFGNMCVENYDSILLFLFILILAWRQLRTESGEVSESRREDRDRDNEALRAQERRHQELMRAQERRHQETLRTMGGGGVGGSGSSSWEPGGTPKDWADTLESRMKSMGSQLEQDNKGGGNHKADSDVTQKRRSTTTVLDRVRSLMRRTKSPLERCLFLLSRFTLMPYWSMPDDYSDRMGAEVLADIYNVGTARSTSIQWRRDHGLERCKAAEAHFAVSEVIDSVVLDDDVPNAINCEFMERLLRWRYGLERVFEDCRVPEDWKGNKPKTKWALLEEYSSSHRSQIDSRSSVGDQQVQGNLQQKALFNKYLSKAGIDKKGDDG